MARKCFCGLMVLIILELQAASAQVATLGNTTISLTNLRTYRGAAAAAEIDRAMRHAKWAALQRDLAAEIGSISLYADRPTAVTTEVVDRFVRSGSATPVSMTFRLTFAEIRPLNRPSRFPDATLALMFYHIVDAPDLSYPRVMWRPRPGEVIEEASHRLNGRTDTRLKAKFGDVPIRTAVQILQRQGHPAGRSLENVITATNRSRVYDTLVRILDRNQPPVGQGELALWTSLGILNNLEEEFPYAYIDGTLEKSFKPDKKDNAIQAAIKNISKDLIKELQSQIGKLLVKAFLAAIGL
jgi:hypothetical protein